MVQPSVAVPARAALQMALRSACSIQRYLVGRTRRSGTSSRMPRGNELYPVERISWLGPTMTQPIWVFGSLLRAATDRKSTRLNSSHSLHDALPIYIVADAARE